MAGVSRDERPRHGLTAERLARLRPAFRAAEDGGTVTAGNSCGDQRRCGGGRRRRRRRRTAGSACPGCGCWPPPPPASTRTCRVSGWCRPHGRRSTRAGLGVDDLDVVELNEAFAGQVLACCDALSLDPRRVCVEGGALALGHPWGASGAVLVVRLFSQLVRAGRGRYGLAAIAVGGGQGVAMVVERCR